MTFDEMICEFDKLSCDEQDELCKILGRHFVEQRRSKIIDAMDRVLVKLKQGEPFDGFDGIFREIKKNAMAGDI